MRNGVYRRTWVTLDGFVKRRMMVVRDGMAFDLAKCKGRPLADFAGLGGDWTFVQALKAGLEPEPPIIDPTTEEEECET